MGITELWLQGVVARIIHTNVLKRIKSNGPNFGPRDKIFSRKWIVHSKLKSNIIKLFLYISCRLTDDCCKVITEVNQSTE